MRGWSRSWRRVSAIPTPIRSTASTARGLFPGVLDHNAAGIVCEGGGVTLVMKLSDHVISLYTAECRQCNSCLSGKANLCTAIRATQGKGQPISRYIGCSNVTVLLDRLAVQKIALDIATPRKGRRPCEG